jgi:hypothetical protein
MPPHRPLVIGHRAPRDTAPNTPSPPTSWPPAWAPTSSNPTWSPPPTVCWWPGTSRRLSAELGRAIGVYPETKSPRYSADRGAGSSPPWSPPCARSPVRTRVRAVVRPREPAPPAEVPGGPAGAARRRRPSRPRHPASLATIAGYADVVGVPMSLVIPRTATGTLGRATALVADAHAAGLAVHAFTFRDENAFLPTDLRRGGGGSDSLRGADGVRGPTRRSGSADAERGDGRAERRLPPGGRGRAVRRPPRDGRRGPWRAQTIRRSS